MFTGFVECMKSLESKISGDFFLQNYFLDKRCGKWLWILSVAVLGFSKNDFRQKSNVGTEWRGMGVLHCQ